MKDVFARLGADFFSTILFIAIYLATDNVLLATGVAIAGAIAQVIYSRIKGKELGYMTWASLALVIVLGSATLLMMLANAAILYVPGLPIWLGLAVAFAARNSAVFFTKWYAAQRRAMRHAPPANALPKAH